MNPKKSNQSVYASLMILGFGILLFRTLRMLIVEQAYQILVPWVFSLLIVELLIDAACIVTSFKWFSTNKRINAGLPLKLGAMATILHAFRVLIYVLGRTGPWVNFDVNPEYQESYTFEWFWVYFAGILAFLGVLGVIIIWQIIRYRQQNIEQDSG